LVHHDQKVLDKGGESSGEVVTPALAVRLTNSRWTPTNVAIVGAGVGLVAAPFLPFINATAALVGNVSRSGIDMAGVEAFVFVLLGAILAGVGIQRAGGSKIGRVVPTIASLAAAGLTVYYFVQINERVESVSSEFAVASIGTGLWLAVAASGLGILLSLQSPDASQG
jgi:hypothetical protein